MKSKKSRRLYRFDSFQIKIIAKITEVFATIRISGETLSQSNSDTSSIPLSRCYDKHS